MNNVTVNNNDVVRFINAHAARSGETFNEVANRMMEKAMKDMQYRSNRNAQKWQETKAMKENVKQLEEKLQRMETLQMIGAGREEEINA